MHAHTTVLRVCMYTDMVMLAVACGCAHAYTVKCGLVCLDRPLQSHLIVGASPYRCATMNMNMCAGKCVCVCVCVCVSVCVFRGPSALCVVLSVLIGFCVFSEQSNNCIVCAYDVLQSCVCLCVCACGCLCVGAHTCACNESSSH